METTSDLPSASSARSRINLGNLAAAGLVAVLLVLPALGLWGALTTYSASKSASYASELSDAFEQARYSVGAEESLERKYRLEPSADVRRRHQAAAASLIMWLERARAVSHGAEGPFVNDVLAKHVLYLAAIQRMFAAIDAGDTAQTNEIDENEADPSFDAIETLVDHAAEARRAEAARHLHSLTIVQTKVLVATPFVLATGLALVALFWRILGNYQRQAREAVLNEVAASRRDEQRFSSLLQNASDVILICTEAAGIGYHTPAAATDWGYASAALNGTKLADLVHPEDRPAFHELWLQALALHAADRRMELRLKDAGSDWRHTELIVTNLLGQPSVEGVVVTIRDITARKMFEQQLTQQAFYDQLTQLPNRALFQDRLAQAMDRAHRRGTQVALLFVDLDNFKLVNDSLGHHQGDVLLAEAAKRLQSCARVEDTVARLGGDEFVVLLHQTSGEAEEAALVGERLIQQFARPFDLDGREVIITASVGVALGGVHAGHDAAESILRNADIAMYRAKLDGKGRHVMFEASMQTDALARLELESDLRHAFDRNEYRVHYQPIVQLQSRRIVEAEALVRWHHPVRGMVGPGEFISIAEDIGLIVPLGRWVLEQACRQAAAWHEEHPGEPRLMMGVNLSPRQFQQPDLVEQVTRVLRESGLAPSSLKLEITEGVAMRDAEATIITMQRLKQLGVQIAIDDFGTGYSSLAYLKRLPIDVLKIDRSFVIGVGENPEDNAIVRAIIALARSLELTITAEGIETGRQALLMQNWGCERGQGYFWSHPVERAEFGAMLRRMNAKAEATA